MCTTTLFEKLTISRFVLNYGSQSARQIEQNTITEPPICSFSFRFLLNFIDLFFIFFISFIIKRNSLFFIFDSVVFSLLSRIGKPPFCKL